MKIRIMRRVDKSEDGIKLMPRRRRKRFNEPDSDANHPALRALAELFLSYH